jgi:hypothetical protein
MRVVAVMVGKRMVSDVLFLGYPAMLVESTCLLSCNMIDRYVQLGRRSHVSWFHKYCDIAAYILY